jgi:putative drug exporter of the RND superfamily
VTAFYAGLARAVVRWRYPIVVLWVVALVATSAALPSLGSEVNNDNSQFLPASAPSTQAATLAAPLLGGVNDNTEVTLIAARAHGTLDGADRAAIERLAALAGTVARVSAVHELGASPDDQAIQIQVRAAINQADIADQKTLVTALEGTFSRVQPPADLQIHIAGEIASNVANQTASNKTGGRTQLLSLVFIVVLLLLLFRSLLAPLITLLPAAFSLLVSTRLIGELGAHGLSISEITELLLIILVLGAGTDYGLFLVFRVREELRNGMDGRVAVEHALARVGESISASAATVILALLTLLLASFGIYHDLGIPLAIGIAVILLAGLTLLPALLAIFGRAAFWPTSVGPGRGGDAGTWGRIASRLVKRPAVTLVIGVVIFGGLATAALGYHSGGFGGTTNAPAGTDAAAGNALLARHYPQADANPANLIFSYAEPVWRDPQLLVRTEASLRASGAFAALSGPLLPNGTALSPARYSALHARLGDPTKLPLAAPAHDGVSSADYNAYRATAAFVSANGRIIQFEAALRAGGQQTTAALNATPQIRRVVQAAGRSAGASDEGVAGEAAALYDVSATSNHDLLHVVPVAILAIGLLLAFVLRSLIAPLYLIVSVVLSYLSALGISTLIFIDIGGDGGLTFILPFLMFIFLLALGEDYNILVMTRIREEAHSHPLREAVVRAVAATGTTVTSAGLVLAGTFGVLVIAASGSASASEVRPIGLGLAIGILMDTFLVRTLLVPATVALLGRWNWWPTSLSHHGDPGTAPVSDDAL